MSKAKEWLTSVRRLLKHLVAKRGLSLCLIPASLPFSRRLLCAGEILYRAAQIADEHRERRRKRKLTGKNAKKQSQANGSQHRKLPRLVPAAAPAAQADAPAASGPMPCMRDNEPSIWSASAEKEALTVALEKVGMSFGGLLVGLITAQLCFSLLSWRSWRTDASSTRRGCRSTRRNTVSSVRSSILFPPSQHKLYRSENVT
jgi:hypothetical protein